jgi:hypothetical protein
MLITCAANHLTTLTEIEAMLSRIDEAGWFSVLEIGQQFNFCVARLTDELKAVTGRKRCITSTFSDSLSTKSVI